MRIFFQYNLAAAGRINVVAYFIKRYYEDADTQKAFSLEILLQPE